MQNQNIKSGFTLIELSIVLVIIGLVVGGVLVGQDLIRQAELRSVISSGQSYMIAVNTFKLKYNCIPGDCPDATTYWGAKSDCADRTNYNNTCNGNNNGAINLSTSTVSLGNERFLFWQHLGLAGLIEGIYTGVEGAISNDDIDPDINTPKIKMSGAAWSAGNQGLPTGITHYFKINPYNYLLLGMATQASGWNGNPITTPAENFNIDKKVDDGKPATGRFVARYWSMPGSTTPSSTSCTMATAYTDITADYNLTNTEISCSPEFTNAF